MFCFRSHSSTSITVQCDDSIKAGKYKTPAQFAMSKLVKKNAKSVFMSRFFLLALFVAFVRKVNVKIPF